MYDFILGLLVATFVWFFYYHFTIKSELESLYASEKKRLDRVTELQNKINSK